MSKNNRLRCPMCQSGTLELVVDGLVGVPTVPGNPRRGEQPEMRMVNKPFLACNGCEFCSTITHAEARAYTQHLQEGHA